MTEAPRSGRQGPPHDPNRDGCGPAVLMTVVVLLSLLLAVLA